MKLATINGRWSLQLPDHRFDFYKTRVWEFERMDGLYRNIIPGDSVLDVGSEEFDIPALLAIWAHAYLQYGAVSEIAQGKIGLIEPSPFVWANCKAIWEANSLLKPKYFVGFASNVDNFNPVRSDVKQDDIEGFPSCAYGEIVDNHGFRHLAQQTDSTPQITIDTFCHVHDFEPDVINMDIEGAEYMALMGAQSVLENYKPLVFVSVHPQFMLDMYKQKAADLFDYMRHRGFERTHIATDHEEHWVFHHPQGRQLLF